MAEPIRVYISSSPDLLAEREVIGQEIAALPLGIGWRIDHTPAPGSESSDVRSRVAGCDIYVLMIGRDFAAPMGVELRTATEEGKRMLAFYKKCAHSPSAQDALRRSEVRGHPFADDAELRARFRPELLRVLLDEAPRLGLELSDLEGLLDERREGMEGQVAERRRGEAGGSGRILGREIWG